MRTMFRALCLLVFALMATPAVAQVNVRLAWDANHEATVTGYVVGVGADSVAYVQTVDVGAALVTPLITLADPAKTYYLGVQAYASDGQRSAFTEITFQTPAAPLPPACTYTLSGPSTVGAGGGSGALSILTTDPSCAWALKASEAWLTVQPPSGNGSATGSYVALANPANGPRTAIVTVQSATMTTGAAFLEVSQGPAPPLPPNPCLAGVPQITVSDWTNKFKLGASGTVRFDLDWTAEIGDRRIAWVETQLGTQPVSRIVNPDVIATLTLLKYRSTAKGLFSLVVRVGDSEGCVGSTGAVRQVRVN